jgi:hypothetical protein
MANANADQVGQGPRQLARFKSPKAALDMGYSGSVLCALHAMSYEPLRGLLGATPTPTPALALAAVAACSRRAWMLCASCMLLLLCFLLCRFVLCALFSVICNLRARAAHLNHI